jgi:hypothetical protein
MSAPQASPTVIEAREAGSLIAIGLRPYIKEMN